MAKPRKRYVCQACGSVTSQWQGQCGDCGEWNTLVEDAAGSNVTPFQAKHNLQSGGRAIQLTGLNTDIELPERASTGIAELDRAGGDGIFDRLYARYAGSREFPSLDGAYRDLGIEPGPDGLRFSRQADAARLRRAIMATRPARETGAP